VIHQGKVYIGTGQNPEYDKGPGALSCFSFGEGKPRVLWAKTNGIGRTIGTCAVHSGVAYFAQLNGLIWALDAERGGLLWEHDLKSPVWSSPLCADGKVYYGTRDGDVYVFAAGREKKLLNKIEMGAPIVATPCAVGEVLYILTETHLYALKRDK
jgi:outer membrane protein assembly factor BamB